MYDLDYGVFLLVVFGVFRGRSCLEGKEVKNVDFNVVKPRLGRG
jgi:hypothetical protein